MCAMGPEAAMLSARLAQYTSSRDYATLEYQRENSLYVEASVQVAAWDSAERNRLHRREGLWAALRTALHGGAKAAAPRPEAARGQPEPRRSVELPPVVPVASVGRGPARPLAAAPIARFETLERHPRMDGESTPISALPIYQTPLA